MLAVAKGCRPGPTALVSIRDVAKSEAISNEYAAKILGKLRRASLVSSVRGVSGGYRLTPGVARLPLSDVMARLDGPIVDEAFCHRFSGNGDTCVHTSACTLRPLWSALDRAVHDTLAGVTLADLFGPTSAPPDARVGAPATEAT